MYLPGKHFLSDDALLESMVGIIAGEAIVRSLLMMMCLCEENKIPKNTVKPTATCQTSSKSICGIMMNCDPLPPQAAFQGPHSQFWKWQVISNILYTEFFPTCKCLK